MLNLPVHGNTDQHSTEVVSLSFNYFHFKILYIKNAKKSNKRHEIRKGTSYIYDQVSKYQNAFERYSHKCAALFS